MTPVNLVSFLISLALIDLQYSLKRASIHAYAESRLPTWLYAIVYSQRPYVYINADRSKTGRQTSSEQWYYSTKQKKLMRMEAEEALRARWVIIVLMIISVAVLVSLVGYIASKMASS
jgi:hypothetical protein